MKLQFLLKASFLLALVIAGRFARDVEQTHPGRSLNDILTSAPAATPKVRVRPVATARPATVVRPQTASFSEVN